MASLLLATKLQIPPQASHAVLRSRLVDAIEQGIPHRKMCLVSAPAGYGKTTLLSQWAHTSRLPVAWLSLGEEDNDVERFFRYLLTGWAGIQPDVDESPLAMLLGAMTPDIDDVLAAFVNLANDQPGHAAFVLDDYHLIKDAAIHDTLEFLFEHLPPTLHFVLAGRAEPPLPLARYRVRDELLELGAVDLQFLTEETSEFLNRRMGLELRDDEIAPLHDQLEGWIAGLQLVALSLRRRRDGLKALAVTGRHRHVADYLSQDVLAGLSGDVRRFLLRTSILERLSGSLCDAVTGDENGQDLLEMLERENLFLMPLDDSREWFRYHRLFGDFLYSELCRHHAGEVAELHRRAARWYLERDRPEEAFHHAVRGEDVETVLRIVDLYFAPKLFAGEVKVVEDWLASLPEDWYASHSILGLAQAIYLVVTGAFDASAGWLDRIERELDDVPGKERQGQLAKVAMVRCAVACFRNDLEHAEQYADQALRDLPGDALAYRADTYHALGDTYSRNGRWAEARACFHKTLEFNHDPAASGKAAHVYGALADLELRQGRLRDAADYWRRALAAAQDPDNWGRLPLPVIGWVYIRMGELLYEWNELEESWDHIARGLERAELGGDVRSRIAGYVIAARLKLTEGDVEASAGYLERARSLLDDATFPDWTSRFLRVQAEVWLARGELRSAGNWADDLRRDARFAEQPERDASRLAAARVLIVNGNSPAIDEAAALLKIVLQSAEVDGRMGVAIEASALEALAHWRRGDRTGALTALDRALRMAEPENYLRTFADLGLPMAQLLQEARARTVMPDHVAKLLATFGPGLSRPGKPALPEPLTPREQEILGLVAAGLTNREIADELFISAQTVKKHAGNIFEKLGVRSRTEAAARARDLELLG